MSNLLVTLAVGRPSVVALSGRPDVRVALVTVPGPAGSGSGITSVITDGVTITGDGTADHPLVATGGTADIGPVYGDQLVYPDTGSTTGYSRIVSVDSETGLITYEEVDNSGVMVLVPLDVYEVLTASARAFLSHVSVSQFGQPLWNGSTWPGGGVVDTSYLLIDDSGNVWVDDLGNYWDIGV